MMEGSPITNMNAYNTYFGNNLPENNNGNNRNTDTSSVTIIAVVCLVSIAFIGGYAVSNYKNIKRQLK